MRTTLATCLICVSSLPCDRQQGTNVPATQQSGQTHVLSFQQAVDAMKSLQAQHAFPKHLLRKDARKRGDEFDVQEYFHVLRHLSMEEGYVLDYVYQYFETGGAPVLYARKNTQPPYATETDLKKSIRKEAHLDEVDAAYAEFSAAVRDLRSDDAKARTEADERLKNRLAAIPDYEYWEWYLRHVRIDGTKQGYLEYVALSLLGGQFYLFWHENYHDTRIVCDKPEIKKILDEVAPGPPVSSAPSKVDPERSESRPSPMDTSWSDWLAAETHSDGDSSRFNVTIDLDWMDPFSKDRLRAKAVQIDPTPHVEIGERETRVSIVTFSHWRGFARWQFTISTRFPHKLLSSTEEVLAPYHCLTFY